MHLPTTYTDVLAKIERRTDDNIKANTDALKRNHERHGREADALTKATMLYMQTGIADLRSTPNHIHVQAHGTGWGNLGWDWAQYYRQLAAEMKRPYVYVSRYVDWGRAGPSRHNNGDGPRDYRYVTSITMPPRRYLAPVQACLHLASEEIVSKSVHPSFITFGLRGPGADALFNNWYEQATTAPECRRALRVI